jgi:hypothetical protein
MHPTATHPDDIARAPEPFRAALAELVELGMTVARMIALAAAAESALAEEAATAMAPDALPVATSLAEAIEADRAAIAAGEARRDVARRTELVAAAFAKVSRAIRQTVLLAERLDRGWARPRGGDCRAAMVRRRVARAVGDAIARDADGTEAERLESLDRLDDIEWGSLEDIVRGICRDLGLAVARLEMNAGGERVGSPLASDVVRRQGGRVGASPRAPPKDSRPMEP